MFDIKKYNNIYTPFFLLVVLESYIIYLLSPELAEKLNYDNSIHFLIQHLVMIGLGMGMLFVMSRLDSVWFDRIGAGVLIVSIVAFSWMLFYPAFYEGRVFLKIGSLSMQPTLYFALGVVWLFDYSARVQSRWMKWILWLVTLGVWLLMVKVDPAMILLIGLSVLCIMEYRYGISKIFFLFLGGLMGVFGLVILNAPHRMQRIQSWWDMLLEGRSFAHPTGVDLHMGKMHEGLFIYNAWGSIALVFVTIFFAWLTTNLWRIENFFAKGVAIVLVVDIFFHIINFFSLTFVKPRVLFIVEYGASITLISFLMMGMVMLGSNQKQ